MDRHYENPIMSQLQRATPPLLIVLLSIAVLSLSASPSTADNRRFQDPTPTPTAVVAVRPTLVEMPLLDSTSNVHVEIQNPAGLYAFHIQLAFEPSVIQIEDADADRPGIQVNLGSLFAEREHYIATNRVDNENGDVNFGVSLLGTDPPIYTDGELITMTVRAAANGTSPLNVSYLRLSDNRANQIPAGTIDATVVVGQTSTPTPTNTPTPVPTASFTPTDVPTNTPTSTPTNTPTSTSTRTSTPTSTPTPTPSPTVGPTPIPGPAERVQLPLILRN